MEKKDLLLVLLACVFCFIFIVLPLLFLLSAYVPQPPCVGLIRVNGEIVTEAPAGLFSAGAASSESFSQMIKEAGNRDEIKAIVVEINSGGGSVVASNEMYLAAKGLAKPKVMYFREVGASGAYYLAMAGDVVMSHPDALTGSIGVRTTFSDMSGLFQKLGINQTTVKSGELKDIGDPSRPPTEKEIALMQAIVNETFEEFRNIVLSARAGKPRFTLEKFEAVLDARVLSGRQAYASGLVDELGSRGDAIKKAAELGGITDAEPRVCELNEKKGFFEALMSSSSQMLSSVLENALKNVRLGGAGSSGSMNLQ
ncbi:Peptidase family S49 [Candidatus Burarchaeum australiense]|nr:Peptidase family S49 [Candidatus Burarchaeum australiense]